MLEEILQHVCSKVQVPLSSVRPLPRIVSIKLRISGTNLHMSVLEEALLAWIQCLLGRNSHQGIIMGLLCLQKRTAGGGTMIFRKLPHAQLQHLGH